MKKILLCALCAVGILSCSESDLTERQQDLTIRVNVGVDATTKAPINSTFNTNFPIGIYAIDSAWLAGSSANWINHDSSTVAGAAGHAVTFNGGPYYYPVNGDTLTFYAFAPFAPETTAAGAGTSPQVTHTINGQQDVMWATARGQKVGSDPVSDPALSFQHKLTQLQFTFQTDGTHPAGSKVVSLKVKAQPTSAVMVIGTGACTFSGSADMQALSATDQTNGIAITLAGTNANSPVMTQAQSGASAYLLDVVVNHGSKNTTFLNVPISVTASAGSAHMITLTFKATAIHPNATVVTWSSGTGGTGTVQ